MHTTDVPLTTIPFLLQLLDMATPTASKRKRVVLTLEKKLAILDRLSKGETQAKIAHELPLVMLPLKIDLFPFLPLMNKQPVSSLLNSSMPTSLSMMVTLMSILG